MPQSPPRPPGPWHLPEAVAGWVVPGLGHLLLGQRARGLILMATIGSLWGAGLLVGGIDAIDRRTAPAWFAGQALVAPSVLIDAYHQRLQASDPTGPLPLDPADPGARPPAFSPSYGPVHEQGVLLTALAGLLNLLVLLDVVYRPGESPAAASADAPRNPAPDAPTDAPAASATPTVEGGP